MSKQQTAVEWLCQQFEQTIGRSIMLVMESEIEQAKQMEKEQMAEISYIEGEHYYIHGQNHPDITFENFFNGK